MGSSRIMDCGISFCTPIRAMRLSIQTIRAKSLGILTIRAKISDNSMADGECGFYYQRLEHASLLGMSVLSIEHPNTSEKYGFHCGY
jgi:hypothetical protein